jgi:hypothetical protein
VKKDSPFETLPSGIEIARYFWHETDRVNNGADGIDLWRDERDYCYLWVETFVDMDMYHAYLLDVRTNIATPPGEIGEVRDFLFVLVGGLGKFDVEWHNKPINFADAYPKHRERFAEGMQWLVSRIEASLE